MSSLIPISETIISNNTGLDAITRAPIVDYETKVRCLRIQNVSHDEPFEMWGYTEVSEQNYKNFQLQKDDIIISRTGGSIGTLMYIDKDYKSVYNNGLICLKIDKERYNPRYIYYCLKLDGFKKHIQKCSLGNSTQENIRMNDMLEYMIPDIKLTIQNQIVEVLKDLDDKIQNNNAINVELESMAKTIYDYWFLQFEFPNEDGKPYKSSGGKMVWNDEIKREIPEGWEVNNLAKAIFKSKNGDWGNEEPVNDDDIKVNCFRGADFISITNDYQMTAPIRYIKKNNADRLLEDGDLVTEISGGSPTQATGRIGYINQGFLNRSENVMDCSNFCKAFTPIDRIYQYWLYQTWKSYYDNGAMFNYESKTTGIKNLMFDDFIDSIYVTYPNEELLEVFQNKCTLFYEKIQKNLLENQELASLRDFLLPMLMNGQISIKRGQKSAN